MKKSGEKESSFIFKIGHAFGGEDTNKVYSKNGYLTDLFLCFSSNILIQQQKTISKQETNYQAQTTTSKELETYSLQ